MVSPWLSAGERDDLMALDSLGVNVEARGLSKVRVIWNCLRVLPTSTPIQASYSWEPGLAARARDLCRHGNERGPFDIVHVEHLRGARYGLSIKGLDGDRQFRTPPIVWDSVDSIGYLFRQAARFSRRRWNRWVTRFELGRSEHYERWLVRQFDHVLVTSTKDRNELTPGEPDHEANSRISVLPNGVDTEVFQPPSDQQSRVDTDVVVSGKMSYHANVSMVMHLVNDIMPRVWAERPDIRLLIVGKNPPAPIRDLSDSSRIVVTGWVPDVAEYLRRASIALTPLTYGAGIQNKVLEAMACATPVVAYRKAVSSMSTQSGNEILVAEDPSSFAGAVLELIADSNLRKRIGDAGRRYVRRHHDWPSLGLRLEEIYDDLIHSNI